MNQDVETAEGEDHERFGADKENSEFEGWGPVTDTEEDESDLEADNFTGGKGTRVRFWEDKWCMRDELKHKFPLLYDLSRKKNKMISKVCTRGEGGLD